LDPREVGLVDIDGIRFLNECRTHGAKVKNGAPYIRECMRRETRKQQAYSQAIFTKG
jgi:hypothetical protein